MMDTTVWKRSLVTQRWGGRSLICLYVSLLSGLVVALQYNPKDPFYSVASLELVAPFGAFWRGLHFYSSQAFFFLLVVHLVMVIWENSHGYQRMYWIRLVATVPVTLLLLFTGYVLRGDATGEAAGFIAEHVTRAVPLVGEWCNDLLFAISTQGMKRVYANHLIGLCVLGTYCGWDHLRRYRATWRTHLVLVCGLFLTALFVTAPMEPEKMGQVFVSGPWFFLGLQELLRYLPPLWAGVAAPLLLFALVVGMPGKSGRARKAVLVGIALWLLGYLVVSLMAYTRSS